ncbi:hypothetical protein GO755_13935 [Spirosoma sp. HMF4905]|uniref:SRPBCC family protein n=1 Tax=Spirosoma arboris TaxID=2682092 RepID=A0A7K1SBE6_9BACT|nr:SRPBCC family protein [Spirosoma arboris]MVM31137.1 hypothetical protein [Spirosoma arboris]
MITIRLSTVIQRSVADVYDFLGCYENDIHWRTGVVDMQQNTSGTARIGMETREVMTFMGSRTVTTANVIAAETNRRTAFRSVEGPVKAWGQRLFEKHPTGTRFTYELNLEPTGILALLSPIVGYLFRQQMTSDLSKLKLQLETGQLIQ